ncbi:hypothetical protein [Aeromicrobium choanae]|uniref:Uncharacterized protein n=1 Tax=Aeromicrobium choanae TaxID=1736691 RepID=A0A1T4Z4X2_9ACTN|nr:hypothetical protein [Aeromicrobium choanae]SKB09102.1 hypothetical protein SAMN06295964_2481 [Aeromicrobium choanae]
MNSTPANGDQAEGKADKLADDLTVDPQHQNVSEPGGDEQEAGTETVPGVEGPEGVPDLPVTDDPGTGGPGDDD